MEQNTTRVIVIAFVSSLIASLLPAIDVVSLLNVLWTHALCIHWRLERAHSAQILTLTTPNLLRCLLSSEMRSVKSRKAGWIDIDVGLSQELVGIAIQGGLMGLVVLHARRVSRGLVLLPFLLVHNLENFHVLQVSRLRGFGCVD
jgi:hypothetical protein